MTDQPDEEEGLWVRTGRWSDGEGSMVQLAHPGAETLVVDAAGAREYAAYCARVCTRARTDALAMRQMTVVGNLEPEDMGALLMQMRERRPMIDSPYEFEFTAHVSQQGKPYLEFHPQKGEPGQWQVDLDRFLTHVSAAFMAAAVTEEDDLYYDFLVDDIGLDEGVAQRSVADLDRYDIWRDR